MPMKNSDFIIGNRTRDLPACTTVPPPTAPPRDPSDTYTFIIFTTFIPRLFTYTKNIFLYNNIPKALGSQSQYKCEYIWSLLPCGQSDDDPVWSKLVADYLFDRCVSTGFILPLLKCFKNAQALNPWHIMSVTLWPSQTKLRHILHDTYKFAYSRMGSGGGGGGGRSCFVICESNTQPARLSLQKLGKATFVSHNNCQGFYCLTAAINFRDTSVRGVVSYVSSQRITLLRVLFLSKISLL